MEEVEAEESKGDALENIFSKKRSRAKASLNLSLINNTAQVGLNAAPE